MAVAKVTAKFSGYMKKSIPLSLEELIARRRSPLPEPQRGGKTCHVCPEGSRG